MLRPIPRRAQDFSLEGLEGRQADTEDFVDLLSVGGQFA